MPPPPFASHVVTVTTTSSPNHHRAAYTPPTATTTIMSPKPSDMDLLLFPPDSMNVTTSTMSDGPIQIISPIVEDSRSRGEKTSALSEWPPTSTTTSLRNQAIGGGTTTRGITPATTNSSSHRTTTFSESDTLWHRIHHNNNEALAAQPQQQQQYDVPTGRWNNTTTTTTTAYPLTVNDTQQLWERGMMLQQGLPENVSSESTANITYDFGDIVQITGLEKQRILWESERQSSMSSCIAVAPSPPTTQHPQAPPTRIPQDDDDDEEEDTMMVRNKVKIVVFENVKNNNDAGHYSDRRQRHHSSSRSSSSSKNPKKPLGLTYALRRTDSGSTFQSLDGLSNVYPLIRKDAKRRRESSQRRSSSASHNNSKGSSSSKKRSHRQRSSSSSNHNRSKSSHRGLYDAPSYEFDRTTLSCLAASCFPMDNIMPQGSTTRRSSANVSLSSFQYQDQQQQKQHKSIGTTSNEESINNIKSSSTREELLRLKMQLRELRRMAGTSAGGSGSSSTTPVDTANTSTELVTTTQSSTTKVGSAPATSLIRPKKTVRFAAPIVTQVTYRPYTDEEDIPLLYFQEEELEALECDREDVSGDQFECQYDEAIMTVRIAYQKQNPADE